MQEQLGIKKQVDDFHDQFGPSCAGEVLAFVICFSRFEYALKKAGYRNGDASVVSPCWAEFASDISVEFDKEVDGLGEGELANAVKYFRVKPPKKQILRDGHFDWKDVPCDESGC